MALSAVFTLPDADVVYTTSVLRSIQDRPGIVTDRLRVLALPVLSTYGTLVHTLCTLASLASLAVRVVFYPVWRKSAPKLALTQTLGHAGQTIKLAASVFAAAPGILKPDWTVRAFRQLGLYRDKSRFERFIEITKRAWVSPYRNRVLLGSGVAAAALFAIFNKESPAPLPLPQPPAPPEIFWTTSRKVSATFFGLGLLGVIAGHARDSGDPMLPEAPKPRDSRLVRIE